MLDPAKLVGMDNYGPMFEQLYQGKCGSLVTGANEYLTFVQVCACLFLLCVVKLKGIAQLFNSSNQKVWPHLMGIASARVTDV